MSNTLMLTDASFEAEVLKSTTPVLVDFWATWCNPCMMIAPMIDRIAVEYDGKIKVGKLDVDSNSNTASTYQVRSIPTLMIFKEGKLVEQIVGVVAEDALKKIINKTLSI
ncbi:MAG: thioredoxin [bacterium]